MEIYSRGFWPRSMTLKQLPGIVFPFPPPPPSPFLLLFFSPGIFYVKFSYDLKFKIFCETFFFYYFSFLFSLKPCKKIFYGVSPRREATGSKVGRKSFVNVNIAHGKNIKLDTTNPTADKICFERILFKWKTSFVIKYSPLLPLDEKPLFLQLTLSRSTGWPWTLNFLFWICSS